MRAMASADAMGGDKRCRAHLLVAKFRVLMDVATPGDHLCLDGARRGIKALVDGTRGRGGNIRRCAA